MSREPPPKGSELRGKGARAAAGGCASRGWGVCVGGTQAEAGARRPEEGAWPRRLRPGDAGDPVGSLLPGAGGAAMLLSGGDPPAQEWFMVQTKSKPRVQRQRQQVQRIFRVKLNAFQSRPDTPYFWLQLEGPRENMGKAKVNSVWPLITSSQTFLPPFAPLPSPLPTNPGGKGPQRPPDLDWAVWRAGTGPFPASPLLQPWVLPSGSFFLFCPTPLLRVTSVPQVC